MVDPTPFLHTLLESWLCMPVTSDRSAISAAKALWKDSYCFLHEAPKDIANVIPDTFTHGNFLVNLISGLRIFLHDDVIPKVTFSTERANIVISHGKGEMQFLALRLPAEVHTHL